MTGLRMAVFAESDLEPIEDFDRDVRLESDLLGLRNFGFRVRRAIFVNRLDEAITIRRELLHPIDVLQVNEMVGSLGLFERLLEIGTPAVGFGTFVNDLRGASLQELGHVGGNLRHGSLVDEFVSIIAIAESQCRNEKESNAY